MDWQQTALATPMGVAFRALLREPREAMPEEQLQAAVKRAGDLWRMLDARLADRAYVGGDALTMGDIALGNAIHRWYKLPVDRPELLHLKAWYDRCASARRTASTSRRSETTAWQSAHLWSIRRTRRVRPTSIRRSRDGASSKRSSGRLPPAWRQRRPRSSSRARSRVLCDRRGVRPDDHARGASRATCSVSRSSSSTARPSSCSCGSSCSAPASRCGMARMWASSSCCRSMKLRRASALSCWSASPGRWSSFWRWSGAAARALGPASRQSEPGLDVSLRLGVPRDSGRLRAAALSHDRSHVH